MRVFVCTSLGRNDGGCRWPARPVSFPEASRCEPKKFKVAVAGDRTRVTRVTGGNTHHYTTTTSLSQGKL